MDKDPDNQILYLTVSPEENLSAGLRIGVCVGKVVVQDEQLISEIIIYKYNFAKNMFDREINRPFKFRNVCICFHFDISHPTALLFFSKTMCFQYNYWQEDS